MDPDNAMRIGRSFPRDAKVLIIGLIKDLILKAHKKEDVTLVELDIVWVLNEGGCFAKQISQISAIKAKKST
ncbi:MAG: hypothetical protein JKY52_04805 [Flavobacteriales bacterium]|nr:hypothetical protein [Flavobacteriales bacterium]